jgi:hypothetical protein
MSFGNWETLYNMTVIWETLHIMHDAYVIGKPCIIKQTGVNAVVFDAQKSLQPNRMGSHF